MSKGWNKTHTYLLIGIFFIVGLLYFALYLTVIQDLKKEKEAMAQEVSMYEKAYEDIKGQVNEENNSEAGMNIQIPADKSPDLLLVVLNQEAKQNHIVISTIESIEKEAEDATTESETVHKASYSVEITGDNLNAINSFLKSMQSGEQFLTIDTLNVIQTNEDVSAQLTFSTYYTNK